MSRVTWYFVYGVYYTILLMVVVSLFNFPRVSHERVRLLAIAPRSVVHGESLRILTAGFPDGKQVCIYFGIPHGAVGSTPLFARARGRAVSLGSLIGDYRLSHVKGTLSRGVAVVAIPDDANSGYVGITYEQGVSSGTILLSPGASLLAIRRIE